MPALRPRSTRVRYTLTAAALSLIGLTIIGLSLGLAIRDNIRDSIFADTQRSALQWIAAARTGSVPHTVSTPSRVKLLELVDSRGRVLDASAAASTMAPFSTLRPTATDRLDNVTVCRSHGGCVLLTVVRFALQNTPGNTDPHFVYAGAMAPAILSTHRLEFFIAIGVLSLTAVSASVTWGVVSRSLRRVEAVRVQIAKLSGGDMSVRLSSPFGGSEISALADTANQALDRLEGALQQQEQFASEASHELRTPITSLHLQLEEALLYPEDVDPHEVIRTALSATDRLNAVINDLLLLARLRANPAPPEPIDVGELVTQEAATHAQRVSVVAQAAPGVRVHGHRMQLTRLIDNLLNNAQRHAYSRVEITAERVDDLAVVSVADDGDGIPPRDRERVFERFTRLADGQRRDPKGSGLGLAISADIAHAHNGTLKAEDAPQGARFVLRLPLLDPGRTRLRIGAASSFTEPPGSQEDR
ncbi:sensor histidine kinase [Actinomadura sp. HBU206391]|uniref:sensor histidine kinase n=1 Tax=Actinomadura sp. HBU206391 TaxID=2731692 RepID=UPI0016508B2C|nr:HAMP domain-containing sensor histidine kinase [Actinomadura sp. HBU206391]MBC6457279.1 HAMP domain-containing histidine kinase [Actinomadura sp. HBU206391]